GAAMRLRPLADFPRTAAAAVHTVFADIDDTLSTDGRLTAQAYGALEALRDAGPRLIPVTGRPAGWCDHIARMWPVDGVVGENGAFWFRYDHDARRMTRWFAKDAARRAADRVRLAELAQTILAAVPGCEVASDQLYREADLAIDFCEDVAPLDEAAVARIVELFEAAGATAKVSSIHVNGWFGDWDKLSTSRTFLADALGIDLDAERETLVFAGDSPNDAPMFGFFANAVGVANVRAFAGRLAAEPRWVTEASCG